MLSCPSAPLKTSLVLGGGFNFRRWLKNVVKKKRVALSAL